MKKTVLLSMIAAMVLFAGCSEETKKSASETASAAKETTQSAVKDAKEAVKETAQKAVETSKEVAQKAKEKATEAVEATKEAVAPAAEAVTESTEEAAAPSEEVSEEAAPATESSEQAAASATADSEAGKALYAKCAACHGADGKNPALNKSAIIAGQSAADLETKILEYKAGTRDVNGMGAMMKVQVATMSDEDIKAVSAYIATF